MHKSGKGLPDFLFIGPMRTGTSWAYEYLKTRENVSLPDGVKETFFFDRNFEKGVEWYAAHFENDELKQKIEVAPSYFHSEEAPERIHKTLGKIPIIVHRRDPLDRSYSHFKHAVRYGYAPNNIHQALVQNPEIISASQYEYQLNRWQDIFGANNVHVLDFNLIVEDPMQYLNELCNILGIEVQKTEFEIDEKVNAGQIVRSPLINGIITSIADVLRSIKIYSIVNFAKSLGLKKLVYGGKSLNEDNEAEQVKEVIFKKMEQEKTSV